VVHKPKICTTFLQEEGMANGKKLHVGLGPIHGVHSAGFPAVLFASRTALSQFKHGAAV
jgi:hypothetical protein